MQAGVYSFSFMINGNSIEIPLLQRAYSWNKNNWERFLNDLKHAFDNNSAHFLGTLLFKTVQNHPQKSPFRLLLDGDQRLTTFAILLKSVFDYLDETEDADLIEEVKNMLFSSYDNRTPKIHHSRHDQHAFEIVFNVSNAQNIVEIETNQKPIIECYRYFSNQIKDLDAFYFRHFLNYLLNSKIWVMLDLEETDNDQIVFDTVNFLNETSACTQMIKNALFDQSIVLCGKDRFEELFVEFWQNLFEKDSNTLKFWKNKNKQNHPQIEEFLKTFAIIENFFNPQEHVLNDLNARYHFKLNQIKNEEELLTFFNSFKEYALLWKEWENLNHSDKGFDDYECRLYQIAQLTEFSLSPLILKLKYLLKENPEELKRIFDLFSITLCQTYINENIIPTTNAEYFDLMQNLDEKEPFEYLKNHFANKRKAGAPTVKKTVVRRVFR